MGWYTFEKLFQNIQRVGTSVSNFFKNVFYCLSKWWLGLECCKCILVKWVASDWSLFRPQPILTFKSHLLFHTRRYSANSSSLFWLTTLMAAFSLGRLVSYCYEFIVRSQQVLCVVKVCGISLQPDTGFPLVLITFHFIVSVSMMTESQILKASSYIKIFSKRPIIDFLKRNVAPFTGTAFGCLFLAASCSFQFCFFFQDRAFKLHKILIFFYSLFVTETSLN